MLPNQSQQSTGHRLAGGTMGSGHYKPLTHYTPPTEYRQVGGQVPQSHHRGKLVLGRLHAVGNAIRQGPAAVTGRRTSHRLAAEPGPLLGGRAARVVGEGQGLIVGDPGDLAHAAVALAIPELQVAIAGDEQELGATGVGELKRKKQQKSKE